MKAKRMAVLLSGLLVLMIIVGWAQDAGGPRPSCPQVEDSMLQSMLEPTAWVRADWNAGTSRWDIDCKQIDAIANMPAGPMNVNASRPANVLPSRRGSRSNASYVNANLYSPDQDVNVYFRPGGSANVTANMAANTKAKPAPKPTRRP